MMFTAIIGPVASLAKTWIEGKQKKAQLKSQVELTKLEATKQKIKQDGTWEEVTAAVRKSSATTFYSLDVEDTDTYFSSDILVHNLPKK